MDLRFSPAELAFRDRLRAWRCRPCRPCRPCRRDRGATTGRPGAGSTRTRAVRDGDHYVINGRKIWTSMAHVADYCELLVRTGTDPQAPPHKDITWLILPMDTPGVQTRPLRTAADSTEFGELILDDVRIPVANRVGAENDGWRVAMVTFSFERGTAFIGEVIESRNILTEIVAIARATPATPPASGATINGATLWDDAALRRDVGRLSAEVHGLWALIRQNVSQASAGIVPERGASVFKLRFTENRQHIGDLAARARPGRTRDQRSSRGKQDRTPRRGPDDHAGVHHRGRHIPDPEEHPA